MSFRRSAIAFSCLLVLLLAPAAGAATSPSFVQTTFYDLSRDGTADHADPEGLVPTPWVFHQQAEMNGSATRRVDPTTATQAITVPASGSGHGDARILQKFPADAMDVYTGTATVSFTNVRNPEEFLARLIIAPLDSSGNQVGGGAGECRSEINPGKDLNPGNNEIPVQVLEVVECVFPNSSSIVKVAYKIGAFSRLTNGLKGSGTVTIHELTFTKMSATAK